MNIPGIFSVFENANATALCTGPWPQVLALLGQAGERIMIDLLIDCSIFLRVEAGYNNYHQINGACLGAFHAISIADLDQGYHCLRMLLLQALQILSPNVIAKQIGSRLRSL